MRTSEKLERAGWVFKEYTGRIEHYERRGEKIAYDPQNDTIVSWALADKTIVPDAIQLELLFEKP